MSMLGRVSATIGRRTFLAQSAAAVTSVILPATTSVAAIPDDIRIGYQKSSILAIVREQKLVEQRYTSANVQWVEFPFGPPLLEAMNADRIDYGYTGNAPPVFAQAARANFLYVAALPGRGDNVAILVPEDSPARAVRDLKGRKVAVGKGSSGHEFLVAALDGANLAYTDIEPVYLAPPDGAAAFARGSVDAWSIWDPYLAIAETTRPVRALPIRGGTGRQDAFFLANKTFTEHHPDVVRGLNEFVANAAVWTRAHRTEATHLFAEATGVDLVAETRALDRAALVLSPMTDDIVRGQQAVADRFRKIGLIPRSLDIKQVTWR